uniref:Si:ch211-186j3.6 n=1 Tax=Fundulus heteroclitus TaxID=8078 RepID=A0A3Q2QXS2_FUNHE
MPSKFMLGKPDFLELLKKTKPIRGITRIELVVEIGLLQHSERKILLCNISVTIWHLRKNKKRSSLYVLSVLVTFQVTASDPDKDADQEALRYSLHGQGAESEFIIDEVTGRIYAQRTLDREERAVWRFVVLATDEGGEGLTGFTDVIINVWDINDNAPLFPCALSCHGDVAENSVLGTSVMEMTATDLDDSAVGQNAVLSYRIVGILDATDIKLGGVPTFSEMFTINPTTGTITVGLGGLDREQVESYLLVVEARDGGGMTGTGTATIQIKDVNDHAPRFIDHSCQARISENLEPNTEVGKAKQIYLYSTIQYRDNAKCLKVLEGYPGLSIFCNAPVILEVRFISSVKCTTECLVFQVEDLDFSSFLHCVVEVDDYNDHAPVFIPHFLSLAPLPEDVSVGTSVAHLVASDSDSGQNRDLTYSLSKDSDPEGLFTIDQSGVLSVARPLDRERTAQHHLVVMATDHGIPALTGSATVQLPLLDVNDNGPEFEASYSPVVFENVAGPQVDVCDSKKNSIKEPLSLGAHLNCLKDFDHLIRMCKACAADPSPLCVSTAVLLLGIFLYTRWRTYKGLKEGVYHVSAHHDGWEDIRENVLNYDEEGGGEEDQVLPSDKHTLTQEVRNQCCTHKYMLSSNFCCQDLARYLCEIIRDADQHPDTGPFDSLQVFSTEGGGSPAGSLSSFSSAGLDGGSTGEGGGEARREETLGEWGPRFEKLRALYERAEASDL